MANLLVYTSYTAGMENHERLAVMAAAATRPRQDPPMPPPPSTNCLRLRDYIGQRMRMSHIDQPLMLMELLGRRSPAPAQDVARRILGEDVTQFATPPDWSSAWWAWFTFNGITAYGNGAYSLIGGDELSDAERDQL
jgi:hypothetical protein